MKAFLGILLLSVTLFGDERFYLFSYRVAVRNGMLINENYNISRSMVIPKHFVVKASCEIGEPLDDKTIHYRLKNSKEEMLICMMRNGIQLRDDTMALNLMGRSTTALWIPPVLIRAEEIGGYAVVEILETRE
ncbi:hypothetical protein CCZ01_07345 [Helicobacter monodelphidis]|uniref:hypothetical protein n=1 Tax=Helicobacter sp. 15-1451 TaxID=2004995 RepID=UPI000DCB49C5|nr:hypothetical protein [Helicobacter sp. 15-1451]RAX57053.1 hypothetical protein CCZ01_07345 [Helicobacter sp. 15-1451]